MTLNVFIKGANVTLGNNCCLELPFLVKLHVSAYLVVIIP